MNFKFLLIFLLPCLISGCYKSDFDAEKEKNSALTAKVQQLQKDIDKSRETAEFHFQKGVDFLKNDQWNESISSFKIVVEYYPTHALAGEAKKMLQVAKEKWNEQELEESKRKEQEDNKREKEYALSGEPIDYIDFYVKVNSGIKEGKRYKFNACIRQYDKFADIAENINSYEKYITSYYYFDEEDAFKRFLAGPKKSCGTVVAALIGGQVTIYKYH